VLDKRELSLPLANGADVVHLPGMIATKVKVNRGVEVVTTYNNDYLTAYDKGASVDVFFHVGRGQLNSAIRRAAALAAFIGPKASLAPWTTEHGTLKGTFECIVRIKKPVE
jgi:hypothetical protein